MLGFLPSSQFLMRAARSMPSNPTDGQPHVGHRVYCGVPPPPMSHVYKHNSSRVLLFLRWRVGNTVLCLNNRGCWAGMGVGLNEARKGEWNPKLKNT